MNYTNESEMINQQAKQGRLKRHLRAPSDKETQAPNDQNHKPAREGTHQAFYNDRGNGGRKITLGNTHHKISKLGN